MKTLLQLQKYMEGRKALFPLALILSALSTLIGMMPFVFIWFIARELFEKGTEFSEDFVITYAWFAIGSAITGVILYFIALTCSHLTAFRVETNMRRKAMEKIVNFPLGFFDTNTSGKIRKIIDDNAGITHSFLAHQMPDLAGSVLIPVITVTSLFIFDWRLGLATMIPIFFSMFIMNFMMGKKGRHFMNKYMTSLEEMNTEAVEYVRGVPVVKVFQQTVYSFKNFHNSIMKYKNMVFAYTKMWEKPMSLYTVIINSFAFILVPVAILLINNRGNYKAVVLNLFFYVLITPLFSQSIMKSIYLGQALGLAGEAVNRMEKLTDVNSLALSEHPEKTSGYNVGFSNVSFTYPEANKKAIDNISFTVPEGTTTALVGTSGGGKTTIARMLPRFWDTDEGKISIGGTDVKNISHEDLMSKISFVFQNTKLFKTTIMENIKYGNPSATEKEVLSAVKMAQCEDIIAKLPDGLNTMIGSEGTYLSGGEQQRIVLARALLKNAPIIVLDEATAFSDPENEYLIQKALKKLTEGKTVLMIAHRLSSVKDANMILVIDEGKIVEQGGHCDLLAKKETYFSMWNEYQSSVKWTVGKEVSNV